MKSILILLAGCCATPSDDAQTVVVVVGAAGDDAFGSQFGEWSERWSEAATTAGAELIQIGRFSAIGDRSDRQQLQEVLEAQKNRGREPLWLVLIGHGTFDGRQARFNLQGPDCSAKDFAGWLDGATRPLVIINCASSSGPFVNALSGPSRTIVTATKAGSQHNFARFGQWMSAAISDTDADLDKDLQVSVLEAFIAASARVAEFYDQESRLATEHALLDDNGDRLGTRGDWFRGVRAVRMARDGAAPDGRQANRLHLIRSEQESQLDPPTRARRNQLEQAIEALRSRKAELDTDAYYAQLETLLVELARLYGE